MSLSVDNERLKLTANLFNSVASGIILASVATPYLGWAFGSFHPAADAWNLAGLSGFGLVVGIVLHLLARRMLGGIE